MEPKHFESLYPDTTREEEINHIVSYVREGNSCQLIGLPGVGRSNILGLLSYNKGIRLKHFPKTHKYIHFVNIDFSEARRRSLLDVVKIFFLSLADSLRERDRQEEYKTVNDILRESLSFQDELVLSQGLKRAVDYLCLEKKLTIIFLFDRFEEYVPSLTPAFFATLRLLRNRAKYRFSVVFSLLRPLEEVVDASNMADFYEFVAGHTVFVRLDDPVGIAFRIAYLEKMTGKTLPKKSEQEVLRLTGGYGKLTRLCVEALLASPEDVAVNQISAFLLTQLTVRNTLLELWKVLTPAEQEYLDSISDGKSSDTDEHQKQYLEKVGLLQSEKLTIPLLTTYIDESHRVESTQKAPIIFDEATNTIKKGEIVLSDTLTRSEFRLLKYLLLHPDAVVDREDIISVVWKEATSTAGVTDQAVDQLIFRVRRKIEEDPNHPEHLQTVKGRGFRFLP